MTDDPQHPCTLLRLTRITRRTRRLYDTYLARSGLSILQFGLLNSVWQKDGASVTVHAAALDLDRTTLSRNLRPLIQSGFLRLSEGRDHRTRAVHITEAGMSVVRAARPMWRDAQDALALQLGAKDLTRLETALTAALKKISDT